MSELMLTIVTPEGKCFEDAVSSVVLPGACGSFQVLPNHAAMVAALQEGTVTVQHGHRVLHFSIGDGFLEVHDKIATVMTSRADAAPDALGAAMAARRHNAPVTPAHA